MGHKRDFVLCSNNVKQPQVRPALPGQCRQGDKPLRDIAGQLGSDASTTENSTEAPPKIRQNDHTIYQMANLYFHGLRITMETYLWVHI